MTEREDKFEADIFAELAKIDACMSELCADEVVLEPDQLMETLQRQTEGLRDAIDALMREVEERPERRARLNQLVGLATRELLMESSFPVITRTVLDERIANLPMDREVTLAVVHRGMVLAMEYAGPGCEILIETRIEAGQAEVRIQADASQSLGEPTLPIQLRSISLTDMLRECGGDLFLDTKGRRISLRMRLGADARIS